ncbi:MAG: hypothetical protein CVV47_08180 [Spirochaetae bacterium HGW-Spirochaetae-3]|nr:MAG: hypothetical protein CVV47_08180 [Spirochaetae bacterium HGW-Spirochaetae-3]
MPDIQELVCIVCPLGCRMTVSGFSGDAASIAVEGNGCARGADYAVREATAPTRTVPSTVGIRGAALPRLPVKTARPVPKGAIMACMRVIRGVSVDAPVAMGAVIVEDLAGTGVQLVATRSMLAAE